MKISEVSALALQRAEQLLAAWLPDGKRNGQEWIARNPTRQDDKPGSFKINTATGAWCDFACGDSGADLIDLYRYLNNTDLRAAARAVADQCGVIKPAPAKQDRQPDDWEFVCPVPEDAPQVPTYRAVKLDSGEWIHYNFTATWAYKNAAGLLLFYVTRYNLPDGSKETPPLTLWRNKTTGVLKWRHRAHPDPRPLYNLDRMTRLPAAQVVVVEGEKCAQVLQATIDAAGAGDRLVVTTWCGGCNSVRRADFKPLTDRKRLLWPDCDHPRMNKRGEEIRPGWDAMMDVAGMLTGGETRIMTFPETEHPDGWDCADAIIDDGWDFRRCLEFMKSTAQPASAPPEPAPADGVASDDQTPIPTAEDTAAAPTDPDAAPFRCLGYNGDFYYYLPEGTRQVRAIKAEGHGSGSLMGLAPLSYWERTYMGQQGPNWRVAGDTLMRACERAGVYDVLRQRGRGAWFDGGHAVLHLGDRLMVDGNETQIHDHRSRYVYEAGSVLEFTHAKPMTNVEASRLREITEMLFWERPIYSTYLAGWCVIAPICGGLQHRPHIWLTGSAGTGKSYVIESIIRPCLGEFALFVQSATTSAGVRQALGCDALPVMFDEFEAEDVPGQQRVQGVLELARQAFSDNGAKILKGGATGRVQMYQTRSCFLMSSIAVTLSQHADETRVQVLSLKKPEDTPLQTREEHFQALSAAVTATLTPEWCAALRARSIKNLPQIRANAATFAAAVADKLGNRRAGDQIGALLAGAFSLTSNKLISIADARTWADKQDWCEQRTMIEEGDEKKVLNEIMQYRYKGREMDLTVYEMLDICKMAGGSIDGATDTADANIRRIGFRMQNSEKMMYISSTHPFIRGILEKTAWAKAAGRILARVPGAVVVDQMRFLGVKTRAVGIPYAVAGFEA
jgi:putative DNA primase/helicase